MVTHAKGHVEAFISDFIWPCDEANQGHLLVSALTLAIWLSQQDPDLHLAPIFIYLSIPDSRDKYPALGTRQPAVGFAGQTPVKGISVQESKATRVCRETQQKLILTARCCTHLTALVQYHCLGRREHSLRHGRSGEHLHSWVIFWGVGLLTLQCRASKKDAT